MRRSCSDSPVTASQMDRVFGRHKRLRIERGAILKVLAVEQPRRQCLRFRQKALQHALTLDQRRRTDIESVDVQEVD